MKNVEHYGYAKSSVESDCLFLFGEWDTWKMTNAQGYAFLYCHATDYILDL